MKCVENYTSSINTERQKPVPGHAQIKFVGVQSVKPAGRADVYNMEVEGYHNFAVNDGIIAHNCIDGIRYALENLMLQGRAVAVRRPY